MWRSFATQFAAVRKVAPMNEDIRPLLADWEFDPDRVQVRIISGDDGLAKIQMRIDLGVLQMERDGRPDGARPEGFESLLDRFEDSAQAAATAGDRFILDSEQCALLLREGVQYYHRYVAAFHLERFDLVVRDTARNLRLFSFVARHARRKRDKMEFEQYRPYVEHMHARARASLALLENDYAGALGHIDSGIQAIRAFLGEYHQEDHESDCRELQFLLQWRRDVEKDRPVGPLERLEQQLEVSVTLENYEQAARIRDQIRRFRATDELREHRTLGRPGGSEKSSLEC
jgi:hypothetical protein